MRRSLPRSEPHSATLFEAARRLASRGEDSEIRAAVEAVSLAPRAGLPPAGSAARSSELLPWRAVTAAASCAVALAYGPLAFFRFAHTDDYALLMIHGYRAVNPFWIGDGRVLGGLLCAALFTLFDTVSSAAVLRLIGLAVFLCCVALVLRGARKVGLEPGWAILSALLFAASPTVQNWMIWGVSSWQMPALLLGLLALFPWLRLFDETGQLSWNACAAFMTLQVSAMLVYQPFALAAWPFIGLSLAGERDGKAALRRGAASVAALAVVLVATLLVTKGITALFVPADGHDRTEVATLADMPGKFWWLASVVYPTVLSFVTASSAAAVYLPAAALIAVGIPPRSAPLWRIVFIPVAVAVAAVAAALPSLATPETTPIRTFVVPALLASLLAGLALQNLQNMPNPSRRRRSHAGWIRVAAAAACASCLGWAGYASMADVAIPQRDELAAIEARLAEGEAPADRPWILVGPSATASVTGHSCGAALVGCESSSRRFALPNMVRLWLRDHGRDVKAGRLFFTPRPGRGLCFLVRARPLKGRAEADRGLRDGFPWTDPAAVSAVGVNGPWKSRSDRAPVAVARGSMVRLRHGSQGSWPDLGQGRGPLVLPGETRRSGSVVPRLAPVHNPGRRLRLRLFRARASPARGHPQRHLRRSRI